MINLGRGTEEFLGSKPVTIINSTLGKALGNNENETFGAAVIIL